MTVLALPSDRYEIAGFASSCVSTDDQGESRDRVGRQQERRTSWVVTCTVGIGVDEVYR